MSPATVADMTALLVQLEAQQTLSSMAVSIVADVTGYKSIITCRNVVWDGYDHTHQFQDDRSTAVYRPSNQTVFEQKASLRMLPQVAPVQTVASQPVQMTNQAYRPNPQQVVQYPSSPLALLTWHCNPLHKQLWSPRAPVRRQVSGRS